eukprot:424510-Amphidinium_carterae.1
MACAIAALRKKGISAILPTIGSSRLARANGHQGRQRFHVFEMQGRLPKVLKRVEYKKSEQLPVPCFALVGYCASLAVPHAALSSYPPLRKCLPIS